MQKSLKDYPKRGEIYIADLDPGFGREIHKKRPVLVISSNNINKNTSHAIIIPSSSIIPNEISEEMIYLGKSKGFDQESILLLFYIRSIDQDRLIKKVGRLSKHKIKEVEEALKLVLGMIDLDS